MYIYNINEHNDSLEHMHTIQDTFVNKGQSIINYFHLTNQENCLAIWSLAMYLLAINIRIYNIPCRLGMNCFHSFRVLPKARITFLCTKNTISYLLLSLNAIYFRITKFIFQYINLRHLHILEWKKINTIHFIKMLLCYKSYKFKNLPYIFEYWSSRV